MGHARHELSTWEETQMSLSPFVLWALAGWCLTGYPRWWWHIPRPDPPPPWWQFKLIGAVAGVIGGWVFTQVFGPHPEPWTVVTAGATAVGALLGSRLAVDLYGLIRDGGSADRG